MSIVRTFYKKFNEHFFDKQILSAKSFLAQTAIQCLFYRYKEVRPSIKCLPNEYKKDQRIPTKTIGSSYLDPECMSQSVGMPLFFNQSPKSSKKISYKGKISPETGSNVQNIFVYFGSTNLAGKSVLRLLLEPEGEMIKSAYPDIRLLNGGTEQFVEHNTFCFTLPHYDRLDYPSYIGNYNSSATKKLPNTDISLRVSMKLPHSGVGISSSYEGCNLVSGDRLLSDNILTDRLTSNIPTGSMGDIYELCVKYPAKLNDLKGNGKPCLISLAKNIGMCNFSGHDDLNLRFLEAVVNHTCNKWELTKIQPYNHYEKVNYDIPMVIICDSYYQFLYRVEVMRQPSLIIDNYFMKMPTRGKQVDVHNIYSSNRFEMKPSREDLIHHFKYINSVFLISPEQTYKAIEFPKGEFGMYLISNGATHPNTCKIQAPCLPRSTFLASLSTNHFLSNTPGFLDLMDLMEIDF